MTQSKISRRKFVAASALGAGCLAVTSTSKLFAGEKSDFIPTMKNVWAKSKGTFLEFAKAMPEDKYGFKPTEEVIEEPGLDDIDDEEPEFQTSAARKSPFMLIYKGSHIPIDIRDLYRGHSCFLIGGGPSLPNMDLDLLRKPGIITMAMNNRVLGRIAR